MKMFRILILFAIILIAFGCDDKNPTENDPDPGEVVLSDETVVLEETQVNEDLQEVSQDGNTFTFTKTSTTEDFEEGDILVSGVTNLMPNGFLKKVTNIQVNSNTIIVTMENASLDEALQQGNLSTSYTFLSSRIEKSTFADGVKLVSNSREDLFSLEINAIFYDGDGNTNTTDDQIRAVGTLNFTAEMLMNLNIANWQLNEFDIQLINTFERDLTFENSVVYNLQEEITLVEFQFPVLTIPIGLLLPITVHPTISVDAYVDASLQAGISFGVTATETMTTGAMYENNNWSPISSYEKTLGFNGPNGYGSIDVQAGLKPQLKTMIYTAIGPYIVLDAYGKFDCSVEISFDDLLISEEISYGLDLDTGLLIEILSHTIANYSMDIYNEEWILHQYEYTIGQAPVVTITSPLNGSQFDLGATVDFAGNATDIQDGDLTGNSLEWISNVDGSLGYGENLSVSDLSQGPHTVTLIATDSDDNTGEDDVSINILGAGNNPPSFPFDPSPADEAQNVSINANLSWDCTDPENDPLTYDVYFGDSPNPPLENSGQTENSYDLNNLSYDIEYETTYYWKIVAHDDHNNSTTGEIWEFTTMEESSGNIPTDYVAYYLLNGNVNDESENGYNGELLGNATVENNFLEIGNNNSDALSVPNSVLNGVENFSFGTFVKITDFHTSGIDPSNTIISGVSPSPYDNLFTIYYMKNLGQWCFTIFNENHSYFDNTIIEDNQWHHIILTRDGAYVKLHFDGEIVGLPMVVPTGIIEIPESGLIIGQEQDSVGGGFATNQSLAGCLDEIFFFNRALTEDEIQAIYNEGGWQE